MRAFLRKCRCSAGRTAWRSASLTALAAPLAVLGLVLLANPGVGKDRLAKYTYKDTQDLVSLVEDAAALVEATGDEAFKSFAQKDSKWLDADHYLFAYTLEGVTVFHPVTPQLVGQNVMDLKDMNGKQIIRQITNIGRRPESDASGWVFYLWEDHAQLTPSWKATYVRKAITPDHKTYVIGSGSYSIKVEKAFVEERVKRAARFLQSAGKVEAFKRFHSRASSFFFLDSYIFVLNEHGETLVDPAFPNRTGRTVVEFQDAVGFHAFKTALKKLEDADEAWVQYLWPKPGSSSPSRKLIYLRKVKVGEDLFIVGSDFFVATPIWMRV
jgi:signal transduction histidine kinase